MQSAVEQAPGSKDGAHASAAQLFGKLTSTDQRKAAARSACLRVDPSTGYNKALAAVKGEAYGLQDYPV